MQHKDKFISGGDLGTEAGELRVVLLIEIIQRPHILAVADQPVH